VDPSNTFVSGVTLIEEEILFVIAVNSLFTVVVLSQLMVVPSPIEFGVAFWIIVTMVLGRMGALLAYENWNQLRASSPDVDLEKTGVPLGGEGQTESNNHRSLLFHIG
jgi:hypothetical protein